MSPRSIVSSFVLAVFLVAGAPGGVGAQSPQGTITGRVVDATSGLPVASAQLRVIGTGTGALTNQDGTYTLRGIDAGSVTVRVLRIGYAELASLQPSRPGLRPPSTCNSARSRLR